ncbi:MAG: glycosyltransferase family 2 protein [Sphingomonas sp.]|nr:glycosyltransferase family 2 protein [Sphingomonas sp.]
MKERILLFVPMYNCAAQIGRVISQLTPEVQELFSEVIVVDNRSTDDGRTVAAGSLGKLDLPSRLLMNDQNLGLGGSHKVAFDHALANGFDYLVVLHGDDQGNIGDIVPYIRQGAHRETDALLGARFMKGSRLEGYSRLRSLGNLLFNAIYGLVAGTSVKDLGSGLNLYRVSALENRWWLRNADDLTFNYHMVLRSIAAGWKIRFFPISWREADQVSNVKLFRQSLKVASLPIAYAFLRRRYLEADYSKSPQGGYSSTLVFEGRA